MGLFPIPVLSSDARWPNYPAIADPARPVWHFGPPAFWMNDPNGTLWHDGWYHVFYQHNPAGEEWANIVWGHARSRDLVHWEHLPLALVPQIAAGEHYCYSGCAALDAGGTPRILYTSVKAQPDGFGTQVIASPTDADLVHWTQEATAPVLDLATHGGPAFDPSWRDPYVFRTAGRTFLVLGARLGDESVIALYENPDGMLRRWNYRGIIHRAPQAATVFFECPNLIQLGKKWLLLTSPVREAEWCTGTFDLATYTFHVERQGRVDESDSYYATQTIVDPTGRTIMVGWVQRFPKQRGWNGRLSAPRRIWLDDAGDLCAAPVVELITLRGAETEFPAQQLGATATLLALPGDHSHEVELTIKRDAVVTVLIEVAKMVIKLGPAGVQFNDRPVVASAAGSPMRVHWLLDRSLIEIFVNDRAVYTRVVNFPSEPEVKLSADGEASIVRGRAWGLNAAPVTMGFQGAF